MSVPNAGVTALHRAGVAPVPVGEEAEYEDRLEEHALDLTAKPARRRVSASVVLASAMLLLVAALVVAVPFLPGYDPLAQDLSAARTAPFQSAAHWLGTDSLGRDLLSRLALAGRFSLLIGVSVVLINLVLGVTLGLVAGYFGGAADYLIMGLADIQLTIPVLLLLVAIIAAVGPSVTTLVVVLGVTFWVRYGRVARVIAASLREREFVLASVTYGSSHRRVIIKHLLPTVVPQLVVMGTFDLGVIITAEASLSYLGLGIQPPTPSWGGMIFEGQRFLQTDPYLCVVPGITVFLLLGGLAILSQHFAASYVRLDDASLGRTG